MEAARPLPPRETLVREGSPLVKLARFCSKVQSVDQRMRLGDAVSAFANCGVPSHTHLGSHVIGSEAISHAPQQMAA
jgi:hypothetical protein